MLFMEFANKIELSLRNEKKKFHYLSDKYGIFVSRLKKDKKLEELSSFFNP